MIWFLIFILYKFGMLNTKDGGVALKPVDLFKISSGVKPLL